MTIGSASPSRGVTDRLATVPNALSILRLATVPVFVYLFVTGRETAAVVLYAVAAWTDFFDGLIARRFHQVSELGKLLDPLADRIFIGALLVALVARGAVPAWLVAVVVGRDLLILIAFPVLERRGVERIPVNFTGKTATAALLFGLTWTAASFVAPEIFVRWIGDVATYLGAALYWVAAALYARTAWTRLSTAEGRKGRT